MQKTLSQFAKEYDENQRRIVIAKAETQRKIEGYALELSESIIVYLGANGQNLPVSRNQNVVQVQNKGQKLSILVEDGPDYSLSEDPPSIENPSEKLIDRRNIDHDELLGELLQFLRR